MRIHRRVIPCLLLGVAASGCALTAPLCLSRQRRVPVATITGEAAPGTTTAQVVDYGTEGSQNDLQLTWSGQSDENGPRLRVYATRIECEQFDAANARPRGRSSEPCGTVGGPGFSIAATARPCVGEGSCQPRADELVQRSLTISHGRGNPERLGPNARYKLWVVADPSQSTTYTIDITSFHGPDC
jgi:hypothetical protein